MIIDIGIACNTNQVHKWWSQLAPEWMRLARVVDWGGFYAVGSALTDHNRNHIVRHHLDGDGDMLWFIDDDTVPPPGALERLLALDAPIAAGVYFLRKPPCNPVVYKRRADGYYTPLWNYQAGEIVRPDSVGMGCTLIKRSVFETIIDQYALFRRARTGSLIPVHRDDMVEMATEATQIRTAYGGRVVHDDGAMVFVEVLQPAGEVEAWPFYALEYGRTEDHHFCEMARRCGFEIVVDTGVECQHWGGQPVTAQNFRAMRKWYEEHQNEST